MIITKKKKGKKAYFYLRHSFRKNGKTITKERYLGVNVPKDINDIISSFRKQLNEDLDKKLEKIKINFQEEWKKIPESAKKKELEEISIAFTYNSNAIEGSTITLEDAREIIHDKISPNKPIRDVKETEEHNNVFSKMLNKKEKITNSMLLEWHEEIFGQTKSDIAGKFRDYLVRIGEYIAPDWQEVKRLMDELMNFISKNNMINPVELSARAHYKFERIHPFGDGNGRIGRLLMNQILWHAGYPMLIIEYKKRKSYYRALNKDEDDFVNYFIRRYLSVNKARIIKS